MSPRKSLSAALFLGTAALLGGCTGTPCQNSNECGAAQVCASAHCQSLQSNDLFFAIEPATGACRPLPVGGHPQLVRGWTTCENPCAHVAENDCIGDTRCQPVYSSPEQVFQGMPVPCAFGGDPNGGKPRDPFDCAAPKIPLTFLACRPNPLPIEPCGLLGPDRCGSNADCRLEQPPMAETDEVPPAEVCRPVPCGSLGVEQCLQRPTCMLGPGRLEGDVRVENCVERVSFCNGLDEGTCLTAPGCHPIGTDCYCPPYATCNCVGGHFQMCDTDDQLVRCTSNDQCGAGKRCNVDEGCTPPVSTNGGVGGFPCGPDAPCASPPRAVETCVGVCVAAGCGGFQEKRCGDDPTCEPVFALQCAPYCGGDQGAFQGGGIGGCGCEPSYGGCGGEPVAPGVITGKSLLVRDPTVVDGGAFAFDRVMRKLSRGADPAPLVNEWLGQITHATSVNGRVAEARPGAVDFFGRLPRRQDGLFEPSALGLHVTSLVNRMDLASAGNCGEARITYARQEGSAVDKRNRMTIIVELGQPDDGEGCRVTAQRWLALGELSGAALTKGLEDIFTPLLAPEGVNQVRTNEFLVGNQPPDAAWELREWRFGVEGKLALAPSKQAVDPAAAMSLEFQSWKSANHAAILVGTAEVPERFLAVRSSEDGTRIQSGDPAIDLALNKAACAGCHLTETQSAFVHVGEKMGGVGRSLLSEFMKGELVARGRKLTGAAARNASIEWRPAINPNSH